MVPQSRRSSAGHPASILVSNAHLRLAASSHLHSYKHIWGMSNCLCVEIFLFF